MSDGLRIGRRLALAACLAAVSVSAAACTGHGLSKKKSLQVQKQIKTHGLIIGFEGLQPFSGHRADNLTKQVAKELKLAQAATSGNSSAHFPLVAAAHANDQPIYVVGYSLGGIEARKLTERCKRAGIPIDILFLLDPGAMGHFVGKIPDNVRKVVFYMSGTYDSSLQSGRKADFLENPSLTVVEFEDLWGANHMNLPSRVVRKIKGEIKENGHGS